MVDDDNTPYLLKHFYENINIGNSISKSLQIAKSQFIKDAIDSDFAHPHYWSNFVLWGNNQPIEIRRNNFAYPIIIVGLFAFFLFLVFIKLGK